MTAHRPLRVLTFLHSFEPGGVERIALRLVRHWRAQGHDAPLLIGRGDGAMAGDLGRDLACTVARPPAFFPAKWEALWMILILPGAIRRTRPDVLFCAGNTYAAAAVAMKLLIGRRCPPILAKVSNSLDRPDKTGFRRGLYRRWLRVQGRLIDRFVGMEAAMTAEIADHMRVRPEAVTIVPDPALSHDLIARLRSTPAMPRTEGRRFVAVGRFAAQKNLPLMLRAFARGARADDRLTLIGDGPQREHLAALARELGIAGQIDFTGYLPDPALLLPLHDVLLLSSDYEGVPAVILEALAANLWIVATDCSRSMAGLLLDGRLGDLVPVGDEARLADAIGRAGRDRQDAGLSRMQADRFTIDRAADLYWSAMLNLRRA